MAQTTSQGWIGKAMPRVEDRRFLTGKGHYIADVKLHGMLHIAVLHSPHAHAHILRVDTSAAEKLPGVIGVLTGDEVQQRTSPFGNTLDPPFANLEDYCMAVGKARYDGEPVVAVAAEDSYTANDALELVDVEYEPLEVVLDAERALKEGAPLIHENMPSNSPWEHRFRSGDPDARFAEADVVVKDHFYWHRFTAAPLETIGAAAEYDPGRGVLTIYSNTQRAAMNLPVVARALGVPQERIRMVVPDTGGGFGAKTDIVHYQVPVALLAMKTGRPVRWIEDRSEHLRSGRHGNEIIYDAEMAFRKDGTILAMRMRALHNFGSQIRREPVGAATAFRQPCGPYRFQDIDFHVVGTLTNKCPVGPVRSYGKMQQSYIVERLVDLGARELGMDPTEVRFKNFIQPEEMPYEQPTGSLYDGGDYPRGLRKAMEMISYPQARRKQEEARREGRLVGIGVGFGMDPAALNTAFLRLFSDKNVASGDSESVWLRMGENGKVTCALGIGSQGQGHETTVAQIVAEVLGLSLEDVFVQPGFDTAYNSYTAYSGLYASRWSVVGVGAVVGASRKLRARIARIAAHLLGTIPEDIELQDGSAVSKEGKGSVSLKEIAWVAWRDMTRLPPDDDEAGLFAPYVYRPKITPLYPDGRGNYTITYPYSIGIAQVEVDRETGKVRVQRFACVEDAGNLINPMIVEGQIHGAIAHQMGGALLERFLYDEDGRLLTSTFESYLAPTAADLPPFETGHIVTPSLVTPLGTRGMGEGAGVGLIATIAAVEDALSPLGITWTTAHAAPYDVWRALQNAAQSMPSVS